MAIGYRSNDIVITIMQNNVDKTISILDLSKPAELALGYGTKQLKNKPLADILPSKISGMLDEYVEFEDDINDVGQVLARVQSFSVVDSDGKENGYRMKVVRSESPDDDNLCFTLVLQDKAGLRRNDAARSAVVENFKGHEVIDQSTGLPNKESLLKDIELMGFYSSKKGLRSCFAVLQIDYYDDLFSQYGKHTCADIVKHVAQVARQNLRPDDVLGTINQKRLGALIIDSEQEAARIVFNRLRWQIAANPFTLPDKTTIGLSVSISFSMISGQIGDKALMEECESVLIDMKDGAVNAIVEVDEGDKRHVAG